MNGKTLKNPVPEVRIKAVKKRWNAPHWSGADVTRKDQSGQSIKCIGLIGPRYCRIYLQQQAVVIR